MAVGVIGAVVKSEGLAHAAAEGLGHAAFKSMSSVVDIAKRGPLWATTRAADKIKDLNFIIVPFQIFINNRKSIFLYLYI